MISKLKKRAWSFLSDESGATAIEYGLIMIIISIAILFSIDDIGTSMQQPYVGASEALKG